MENFCLYNGKKIAKLETWDITSVELSSDYTSAIIQAESKSNKSEYTLDITLLISNQYVGGLDPYTATIVNELTGVSDWVLDSDNNSIKWIEVTDYQFTEGAKFGFSSNPSSQPFLNAQDACLNWMQTSGRSDTSKWQFSGVSDVVDYTPESGSFMCNAIYIQTGSKDRQQGYFSGQIIPPKEEEKYLPLPVVAQQVISNAESGDSSAQQAIISTFNNITDSILNSDYSEFFEQNKQPKQEGE